MSTAVAALKYPHIEKPADGPARLESHPRVRVSQIVASYLAYGWSVPEMCRQYPYLKPAEAHAAMAYFFDHTEEIEREIEEDERLAEEYRLKAPPSPFVLRMRAQGRL